MNNIKLLKNYILYFLLMLLVCMIGVSGVFAETLENIGYLDNYTDVLVEVSYNAQPLPLTRTNTYQLGSVNAMNIEVSNYTFTAGITYVLEFYTPHTTLDYANAFTVVGNDNNNNSVSCATSDISYHDTYYLTMKFNCSSNVNYINARVYNSQGNYIMDTGIFAWNYLYLRSVASGTDLSVLESQNAQIIQGQQDIIDNQNENTDKVIESQKVCNKTIIDKNSIFIDGRILNSSGTFSTTSTWGVTDYIEIFGEIIIKISENSSSQNGAYLWFYDIDKNIISGINNKDLITNQQLTIPTNAKYVRFSINKTSNIPQFEITKCINGNQAVSDSINDLNDTLKDSSGPDVSSLNDMAGWLPAGPVDSILNLPLTFFNTLNNVLSSSTCQPVNLTLPFVNKTLSLPCFSTFMSQYLPNFNTLWTFIGGIVSVLILYTYLLNLYKWVDDTLTFRENNHIDNWGGV